MNNKLWIFGCSFSYGYLNVGRDRSYGSLLAKEWGMICMNKSVPGRSNDMILFDLLSNVDKIKEGDYVILQFSSFDRVGHFVNEDPNSAFSTAGFIHLGIDTKMKEYPFNLFDREELEVLLKYVVYWQPRRVRFDIDNTISVLNLINTTKNVNYSLLCVNDNGYTFNDKMIILPTHKNPHNISMYDFFVDEKLTLSDEFPEDFDYYDTHPGVRGHQMIKSHIVDQLS